MAQTHKIQEVREPRASTNVRATIIILGIMVLMLFAIAYTFLRM
jgi:hypothetical protein